MNKLLPFFLLVLTAFIHPDAHSQEKLPEFGKVDIADMQMKECAFDKGANAMNLIKTETISFNTDGFTGTPKTIAEYRVRIKIFNESGFEHASIVIPYSVNSHSVKITDIDAYIYTLDNEGKIVAQKLDKNEIFKEKSKSGKSRNSVRFTFPGLKSGAIIEYRYTRVDKNVLYMPPWLFQDELPCRVTKCTVTVPNYMHMQYHNIGSLPLEKDSSIKTYYDTRYNETKRTFTVHDVPAFKVEPFMSSLKDNLQRVEFTTRHTGFFSVVGDPLFQWILYSDMLQVAPFFGLQFEAPIDNTTSFIDSLKTCKRNADIINAAYSFVKRKIAWNGERNFYPVDLAECWKDKTGSSAEMNILLLNLLRKAGVLCDAVLVSTRDNGRIDKSFPSMGQFNGVDVMAVDSNRTYLLDCTQKNLSYQTTPFDVLNRDALLIDKRDTKWVNINDDRPLMKTLLSVHALLDSTGTLQGSGQIIYTGIAKAEAIEHAEKDEKDKDKENTNNLVGNDGGELKIDSATMQHGDDDNDTLVNKIMFHYNMSSTGDIYFLNPFMFSMFKKNPFKDSSRFSDIDFGSNQLYATNIYVSLPKSFSIEDVPKSKFIRMADSSVMFKREIFTSANTQLLIRNTFTVNRTLFDKEEYSGLKSFFDKVYALINEQVVLKKKE